MTFIKNRLKLDRNSNRRPEIFFEIQIGTKLTIEFGRLEIRIVDDSLSVPLIALAYQTYLKPFSISDNKIADNNGGSGF